MTSHSPIPIAAPILGLNHVTTESIIVNPDGTEVHFPLGHTPNMSIVTPIGNILSQNALIATTPAVGGMFKLCENHPRMKDCICAAYPNSVICKKEYCLNHPNFYECSPSYCARRPDDIEACRCKFESNSLECRCKLNPISKECFCLRFPESKYCLPDFCNSFNNLNQIFCLCKKNPFALECKPSYCHENKFDSRCKCLLNNLDESCFCYIYPSDDKCKNFNYETNTMNKLDDSSSLLNKLKNSISNNKNKEVEVYFFDYFLY